MAPEYVIHGQFSVKSDVFSFGVLVLEIVSGQKNSWVQRGENEGDLLTYVSNHYSFNDLFSLHLEVKVEHVTYGIINFMIESESIFLILINYLQTWQNWRKRTTSNIVDPTISGSSNEIMRCIHIALLCVQEKGDDRPTMASVALMLNSHSVTLPLPSKPAFSIDSTSLSVIQSNEPNIQSVNEASITEPFAR